MSWSSAQFRPGPRRAMGKRGAPKCNQNARKHGFYARVMTEAERLGIEEAGGIEGLDDEIALIRVKLRHLIEEYPDRIDLHMKAANIIARLIRTRYNITAEEKKSLKEAISTVLKEVALTLGLKFIP